MLLRTGQKGSIFGRSLGAMGPGGVFYVGGGRRRGAGRGGSWGEKDPRGPRLVGGPGARGRRRHLRGKPSQGGERPGAKTKKTADTTWKGFRRRVGDGPARPFRSLLFKGPEDERGACAGAWKGTQRIRGGGQISTFRPMFGAARQKKRGGRSFVGGPAFGRSRPGGGAGGLPAPGTALCGGTKNNPSRRYFQANLARGQTHGGNKKTIRVVFYRRLVLAAASRAATRDF